MIFIDVSVSVITVMQRHSLLQNNKQEEIHFGIYYFIHHFELKKINKHVCNEGNSILIAGSNIALHQHLDRRKLFISCKLEKQKGKH